MTHTTYTGLSHTTTIGVSQSKFLLSDKREYKHTKNHTSSLDGAWLCVHRVDFTCFNLTNYYKTVTSVSFLIWIVN